MKYQSKAHKRAQLGLCYGMTKAQVMATTGLSHYQVTKLVCRMRLALRKAGYFK